MKRVISIILAVMIVICAVPTASFFANAATTVSTGNEYIDDYLNLALSLDGKKQSYFGFKRAWCDLFVGWLGEKLNYDFIPPQSACSYCYGIGNWVGNHGGKFVYFYSDSKSKVTSGTLMKEADFTPKPGDIVFLRQVTSTSSTTAVSEGEKWSHIAIVYKVTSSYIQVVHGNWSNKVTVGTKFYRNGWTTAGLTYRIAGYARPNWPTIPVAEVKLNVSDVKLPLGLTCQIETTTLPPEATAESITYKSGNTSVATVDDDGLVTPVAVGETDITVTADDATAKAHITVTEPVGTLYDNIPSGASAADYKSRDLYRYVYNEKVTFDTKQSDPSLISLGTEVVADKWSEEKTSVTMPVEGPLLKITDTAFDYNRELWTATTDIPVYSDKALTEKTGTIKSGTDFATHSRSVSNGKVIARTDDGYVAVRTAASASAYAKFKGTNFIASEDWKIATSLRVREKPDTSATQVTTYSSGKTVSVTDYAETDTYLWGKTSDGWIAMYNYSSAENNATKQSDDEITVHKYVTSEGKTVYAYLQRTSESSWQVAPLTANGTTTFEKKTFYYCVSGASSDVSSDVSSDTSSDAGSDINSDISSNVSSDASSDASSENDTVKSFDQNGDGKVDSSDLLTLQVYLLTGAGDVRDLDGDGKITSTDLLILQQFILGTPE